jgi:hypothetical protein
MAFELEWVFNISTRSFIASLQDARSINPPEIVSGDTSTVFLTFVKNGSAIGTVQQVTASTSVLVSIVGALGGTVATSASATGPNATGIYTVVLPLGVAGIVALIETTAFIEFKFGTPFQSYIGRVKIRQYGNSGAVDPTPPNDVSLGTNAAKNMFVLRDQREYADASPSVQIIRTTGGNIIRRTWDDSGQQQDEFI